MSLLFNMLSRLVITFLPRSKHLLISRLQSPSAVILDTLPCVKQLVKSAIKHRELNLVLCDDLDEWDGKDVQEGRDIHVCIYIYRYRYSWFTLL